MKRHMHIPVRDQLTRTDAELKRLFKGSINVNGKALMTGPEIRDFFLQALSEGYEKIPCGECNNFDKKDGCHGHPDDDSPASAGEGVK